MDSHHTSHGIELDGWLIFQVAVLLVLGVAAVGYSWALWVGRSRSPWPAHRTVLFYAGLACVGVGLVGPLAQAAHGSFTAHMAGHVLVGMLAPLLLVRAAPVTAVLRGLPVARARALSRVLRWPLVRVITHPVTALILNAGGLWVLYNTPLFEWMHASVGVHALVHLHIFLAGYVFTAAIAGADPDPHRASFRMRSVVLIVFMAAHSVLAKWLYAYPAHGVTAEDAHVGAQLMYYAGDVVDVTLIVLLFAGWYRATRPREAPHGRVGAASTAH